MGKDPLISTIKQNLKYTVTTNHFVIFTDVAVCRQKTLLTVTAGPKANNREFATYFNDLNIHAYCTYYLPVEYKSPRTKDTSNILLRIEVGHNKILLSTYDYYLKNESEDNYATLKKLVENIFNKTIPDNDFEQTHTGMEDDATFKNDRCTGINSVLGILKLFAAHLISSKTSKLNVNYYSLRKLLPVAQHPTGLTGARGQQKEKDENNSKGMIGGKNGINKNQEGAKKATRQQPYLYEWLDSGANFEPKADKTAADAQGNQNLGQGAPVDGEDRVVHPKIDKPKNTKLPASTRENKETSNKAPEVEVSNDFKNALKKTIVLNYLEDEIKRLFDETNFMGDNLKESKYGQLKDIASRLSNNKLDVFGAIRAIKVITNQHRETKENSPLNYYLKFNWLRNTTSYNNFAKLINNNDDIKESVVQAKLGK